MVSLRSVEDRRPIYANLIKFAELHPTKIKLGVYAPTGSDSVFGGSGSAGSCTVTNGARAEQVDEHPSQACTTFIFEIEEYPEAKSLSPTDLKALYDELRSYRKVAQRIGASEAYVRQSCQTKKYKNSKTKEGGLHE